MGAMPYRTDPVLLEAQACLRDRRMPDDVSLRLLFAGLIAREQSEGGIRRWLVGLSVVVGLLLMIHLNPDASESSLKDLITWATALFGG